MIRVLCRGCLLIVVLVWSFCGLSGTCRSEVKLERSPLNPAFQRWVKRHVHPKDRTLLKAAVERGYIPPPAFLPKAMVSTLNVYQALPASYDLRDPNGDGDTSDSRLTPVKNQGSCGACWTFGTYGALESTLKTTRGVTYDFSEDNLKHRNGFDFPPCGGGNWLMAMAYMTRNDGPIDEADDPWDPSPTSAFCTDCTPKLYVGNMGVLPDGVSQSEIKAALYQHGALVTAMYWEDAYYDPSSYTYLYNGTSDCNHAVVLVGWDDSRVVPGATGKGAWIVRNSWGSAWGDGGYFYISYEDTAFGREGFAYFEDPSVLRGKKAERVYYYDKLGRTGGIGSGSDTLWGANKFVASEDGRIDAVVFYASAGSTSYEIRIYKGGFDGSVVSSQSGTLGFAGWYTVMLDVPLSLKKGDTFVVAVKFTTPGYTYPVPIEDRVPNYTSSASASPGQSYISTDGVHWTDLTSQFATANVCIKAVSFTQGSEPSPTPEPEPEPEPSPTGHRLVPGEITEVSHGAVSPEPDSKIYLGFGSVAEGGDTFDLKAAFPAYLNESGEERISVKIFVAGQIPLDYSYLFFFSASGLKVAPPDLLSPWKSGVSEAVSATTILGPLSLSALRDALEGTSYWYTLVVPNWVSDDLSGVNWNATPWELTVTPLEVE